MVASRSRLPKLAPDTILRERLLLWLSERADVPVRLIAAPAGTGKTTTLISYATASAHATAYVALEPSMSSDALCAVIALRLGLEGAFDEASLVEQLASAGRCEILVDDVHAGSPELVALLGRLVYDAPDNVTFVYATRRRDVVDVTRLVSLGLAAVLGAELLAFTPEEATRLAVSARVVADENDVARLVHETEGWAFALCSVLRYAAAGGGLSGAFARWRRDESRLIVSFVDRAFASEEPALAIAARRLFDGETLDIETIDRLETRGMFVRWRDGAFHPYRALARCPRLSETPSTNVLVPFTVRLFGAPTVTYDNRTVAWVRRRDAHLFAFLAVQPNGRASRQALLRAFWPDAERPLAGQNLRSACSTMRRALAETVGYAALAHYITFGDDIALNLALFSIDARTVRAHVRDADAAWAAGADGVGQELDLAALALAIGPFLNGDVPPALEGVGAELVAHLARCRSRSERSAETLSPAV